MLLLPVHLKNVYVILLIGVAEQQISETGSNPAPWSADEQKLLEQALRTFPASTEERWEKIAANIPNRTKKDCMKRYKVSSSHPHSSCITDTVLPY